MYIPRKRQFWSVGVGHLTNDIFMASGSILLIFLSTTIVPMSNTQIGFALGMQQLSGALTQPLFGLRADKTGGRVMGSGGLAWVISMFVLTLLVALFTRNYYLMLMPFLLQGLGSGAFHPVGMLHASEADLTRSASHTAYFFLMGQLGLAIGPALVGFMLDTANPELLANATTTSVNIVPLFFMALFALPVVVFMLTGIPAGRIGKVKEEKVKNDSDRPFSYAPFAIIALLVIIRALAQPGSANFIPALFEEKGWTAAQYGLITSSFWVASGVAGVVMGNLADRFDRRWIVLASMVISAPAFFLLPVITGPMAFVLAIIAGGFSGGSHSIIVVLAQELVPNSKGFASGAILGFIFASGAVGNIIIGAVSDSIGLGVTFQIVAVTAVISGFVALLLPKRPTLVVA
jgi:FSR family fosmidomycin resistance protein-like MFS transporter